MRLVRFASGAGAAFGIFTDDRVHEIEIAPDDSIELTGVYRALAEVELLAPVEPSKVVAVGLNYRDHAAELGMDIPEEPVLFLKAPNTVLPPGGTVVYPPQSRRVDYEAELAVVIGSEARGVTEEEAIDHVIGYTVGLDMTARDLQVRDGQWTRAKNFDGFCPLGPWVETDLDPGDLAVELRLNGEVRQSSRTSQMIFSVALLVSFISGVMTLVPGDVVMTGTPPGVGEVKPGDRLEAEVEGIGMLSVDVQSPFPET